MRSVTSRSIGSRWVARICKDSELPSASRTVNPAARSVLTQINRIDGSSSTTRIVFRRDGGVGACASMKNLRARTDTELIELIHPILGVRCATSLSARKTKKKKKERRNKTKQQ